MRGSRGPLGFGWSSITRAYLEAERPTPGVREPWRERHEPSAACAPDHCYAHDIDEPIPVEAVPYRVCGECFHYFPSARALLRDYHHDALRWSYLKTIPARELPHYLLHVIFRNPNKIHFCPHCLHDW